MAEDEVIEDSATETEDTTDEPLGPSGVKALQAMKEQLKAARAEARTGREAARRLADLETSSLSEQEKAVKTAREEASKETASRYRTRIVTSEIKAAAGGKLADPADAVRLLDLDGFELDDNDQLDPAAVAEAIDNLLAAKPYLAAGKPAPFGGSADQGTRLTPPAPTLAERIAEAQEKGDNRTAIALKSEQLAQLTQQT